LGQASQAQDVGAGKGVVNPSTGVNTMGSEQASSMTWLGAAVHTAREEAVAAVRAHKAADCDVSYFDAGTKIRITTKMLSC
jgi:hypothetical protein